MDRIVNGVYVALLALEFVVPIDQRKFTRVLVRIRLDIRYTGHPERLA